MQNSDLQVKKLSESLQGKTLDVIVSGSIGAVESIRFIRSLRRLGAQVVPWLSEGGAQFVTETSLAWAAAQPVRRFFSGEASHIACHDALVIAPASANFLSQIAQGLSSEPCLALAASYLGMRKPVFAVPNMHESLAASPFYQENLARLRPYVQFLDSRNEEGKRKFPDPAALADEVSHALLQKPQGVLISLGGTRGFIDDIRYIGNYSSGRLGTLIAEELYRCGFATHVVAAASEYRPKTASTLHRVETNAELSDACHSLLQEKAQAAVLAAAVLDYVPMEKRQGKIKSDSESLTVSLHRAAKIIASLQPSSGVKVGFKLEASLGKESTLELARSYISRYQLSLLVANAFSDVSPDKHTATLFAASPAGTMEEGLTYSSKDAVAQAIALHVRKRLADI